MIKENAVAAISGIVIYPKYANCLSAQFATSSEQGSGIGDI